MKKIPEIWRLFFVYVIAALMVPTCIVGYFAWYFCMPCTQYSSNYNEEAFQSIQVGQSLPEVLELMGPPYRVVPPYLEMWKYDGWSVFLGDDGKSQVEGLYDWDRETIREEMGNLPPGTTVESISGMSRDELIAAFGKPVELVESPWGRERLFFYTQPASGGMWADRTWKERLLYVDSQSNKVTKKFAHWVVAGTPQG